MDVATLAYNVDTASVEKGTKALDEHAKAAGRAAGAAEDLTDTSKKGTPVHAKATEGLRGQQQAIRSVAQAAALAGGPMGNLVQSSGFLYVGASRLSPVLIGGVVALGALTAAAAKAVGAFIELERAQQQITNALSLTNSASGQTAASIEALVQSLSRSGMPVGEIRAAANELIRFRAVTSSTFGEVLPLALKAASTGFADLKTATTAFGQAIQDPINNLGALEAVVGNFTAAERNMIRVLVEHGKQQEATRAIIDIAKRKLSEITVETDTISSSYGRLANATGTLLTKWGQQIAEALRLKGALQGIADAAEAAAKPGGSWLQSAVDKMRQMQEGKPGYVPRITVRPTYTPTKDLGAEGDAETAARIRELNELKAQQAQKLDAVTIALGRERDAAGLNEVQARTLIEVRKAEVEGDKEKEAAIGRLVTSMAALAFMQNLRQQFIQQSAGLKIEADTFNMAAGAAAAYRYEFEKMAEARARGFVSAVDIAAIQAQAREIGKLTDQVQRLRDAKQAADAVSSQAADALFDFATKAKTASEAIMDLTRSLLRMMMQALLAGQGPFAGLFGTGQNGGLFGGLLKSLLGGMMTGGNTGGERHTGSFVGSASDQGLPQRFIPSGIVPMLPRYHSGLEPDERLAVLQTGERVQSRSQVAAERGVQRGGGSQVVINNYTGQPARTETRQGPDGKEMIHVAIGEYLGSGKGDGVMRGRFGVSPSRAGR